MRKTGLGNSVLTGVTPSVPSGPGATMSVPRCCDSGSQYAKLITDPCSALLGVDTVTCNVVPLCNGTKVSGGVAYVGRKASHTIRAV